MSKENSEHAHSLDEEIIATKEHDQESNDQSQDVNFLGKSFSRVGQVFMTKNLTASPRNDPPEDSDDETVWSDAKAIIS